MWIHFLRPSKWWQHQWVSPISMVEITPRITDWGHVPGSLLTFCRSVGRQPGSEASVVSDLPDLHERPEEEGVSNTFQCYNIP